MTNPFIQTTPEEEREMLQRVGASSIDEIFRDQIPAEYQFKGQFDVPPALSELEIQRELGKIAAQNRPTSAFVSFMGGGVYDHFIPSAVGAIANRSEFVTSYTPYQPEASQGTLQAFFEFQTLVARLFDMPVANASLYDGGSALGEAVFLALGVRSDRTGLVIAETVNPEYVEVVQTYLKHFDVTITAGTSREGITDIEHLKKVVDQGTAAVVVQHPNFFGCLEEVEEAAAICREAGALFIVIVDPLSLGLIAPPGEYGADIAVAEGQCLGLRQFFGGESLGLFTCKQDFIRKVPGRLVGVARDKQNRQGYVLTLQTREQHIRREKATSNICTNHAHNALRATIYMSLMGPQGLERVARACARNLQRLRSGIEKVNAKAVSFASPCFKEMVLELKRAPAEVCEALRERAILAGVPLDGNRLLVCTTEKRTDEQIDELVEALRPYL